MALNQKKITAKPLLLNKRMGETPLQALDRLRLTRPKLRKAKLTYAGRLDPLASGLLLVLSGEDCKNKEPFLLLPKTYEVEILFGVATDSHDILGKITKTKSIKSENFIVVKKKLVKLVPKLIGKQYQEYPEYSTPKLAGKKHFGKEIEIFSIRLDQTKKIVSGRLEKEISQRIKLVNGDFRQAVILKKWAGFFEKKGDDNFYLVKLVIKSGSGTYMRLLAHEIGRELKVPALAYSINRIQVGNYSLDNKTVIK